jgi:hypothetical protein
MCKSLDILLPPMLLGYLNGQNISCSYPEECTGQATRSIRSYPLPKDLRTCTRSVPINTSSAGASHHRSIKRLSLHFFLFHR